MPEGSPGYTGVDAVAIYVLPFAADAIPEAADAGIGHRRDTEGIPVLTCCASRTLKGL
jgi:hypothetical protein